MMLRCPEGWQEGITNWIPPLGVKGSSAILGEEDILWPGVRGYALQGKGKVYIPLIFGEPQGAGNVGRFLDALDLQCVIPNVTSPRLAGMLERRGWVAHEERDPDYGVVEVWSQFGKTPDHKPATHIQSTKTNCLISSTTESTSNENDFNKS